MLVGQLRHGAQQFAAFAFGFDLAEQEGEAFEFEIAGTFLGAAGEGSLFEAQHLGDAPEQARRYRPAAGFIFGQGGGAATAGPRQLVQAQFAEFAEEPDPASEIGLGFGISPGFRPIRGFWCIYRHRAAPKVFHYVEHCNCGKSREEIQLEPSGSASSFDEAL